MPFPIVTKHPCTNRESLVKDMCSAQLQQKSLLWLMHSHLEGTYMLLFDPATLPLWSTIKRYTFAADVAEWLTFTLKQGQSKLIVTGRITDSTSGRFMAKQRHTALKTLTIEHRSGNLLEVRASTAPKFAVRRATVPAG